MSHPLVLLVDDNESSLDMLRRRLGRAGYSVITAMDGEEAVNRAASHVPDLILMDKRLPRLDGYAAVRRIRREVATRDIPVICLTADATHDDERWAREAGCQRFMTKPVNFPALLAAIDALLGAAATGG